MLDLWQVSIRYSHGSGSSLIQYKNVLVYAKTIPHAIRRVTKDIEESIDDSIKVYQTLTGIVRQNKNGVVFSTEANDLELMNPEQY